MHWRKLSFREAANNSCATEDCDHHPVWCGKAGGVGSYWCRACRLLIEAAPRAKRYFPDNEVAIVSPPDDSLVKRIFLDKD